jgi:lipoyl synthase
MADRTPLPVIQQRVQGPAKHLEMPEVATGRKPAWLKVKLQGGPNYADLRQIAREGGLHTVCEEAKCPNIAECWEEREATFLIGGNLCTRRCAFCDVTTAPPEGYDETEPAKVADAVAQMGLRYAVITGVARDDRPDGGAWLYAEVTRQIRAKIPGCGVELLAPDFKGSADALRQVTDEAPEVLAHNLETVPRLFRRIRPAFTYEGSLDWLRRAREWLPSTSLTKSNLILGMGEKRAEISAALSDLRDVGCDLLTIGQYLRPSDLQMPVARFVHPDEFAEIRAEAEALGFAGVESGPLVRSSYFARRLYRRAMAGPADA